MVKVTYKGETRNIPKRYIPDSLSDSQKKKQIKSIFEGKDRPELKTKKRKSSYTIEFNKVYGDKIKKLPGGKNKKNISKVSGIPYKAIDEVYKKGEAAYFSSGSRPNQTPFSWGLGRVYSYIMGGDTREIDKNITKKYKVKFKH